MVLRELKKLGDEVERRWLESEYRYEDFPEIAEKLLEELPLTENLSAPDVLEWALSADSPIQSGGGSFSDLPVIAYNGKSFVLQLLVWNEGIADIHQHSFSGAFRVLEGSSLHSSYDIQTVEHVSQFLSIVDLNCINTEIVRKGDVRAIKSGSGLTHSAFHLDSPTISLVLRTRAEPWNSPSYSIIRPNIMIANSAFDDDDELNFLVRGLFLLRHLRDASFLEVLLKRARSMDFASICHLVSRAYMVIGSDIDDLVEDLRPKYGEKVVHLEEIFATFERNDVIKTYRRSGRTKEERVFAASLLASGDKNQFDQTIQHYFGDHAPEKTAKWSENLPMRMASYWQQLQRQK